MTVKHSKHSHTRLCRMTCLTFFIPHLAQILVPVCIEGSWFVYSFGVSEKEVHVLDPDSTQAKSKDISVLNRLVCWTNC